MDIEMQSFFDPWSSLHDIENRAGSRSNAADKDWVLTPAQSSSPVQPSTPKTPTRFHTSNMSMHAIGSPNAQSHVYPPSYSKESQTPQNQDIGDVFISNPASTPGSPNPEHSLSFWNSLHEHPSAQDVQSAAISAERPVSSVAAVTVEPDEVDFERMDDSNAGNLHQLHSDNGVSSVDLTETNTQSIPIESTTAGQALGTETTIHPPGHFDGELLSSDTSQSIVKFSFNSPTSAMLDLAARLNPQSWNWNTGLIRSRRRRFPLSKSNASENKVRIIMTPDVEEAIRQAQEATRIELQSENEELQRKINNLQDENKAQENMITSLQKEKNNYELKISEKQLTVDILKKKIRDSEAIDSPSATQWQSELKRAKKRISDLRTKFEKLDDELHESMNLLKEELGEHTSGSSASPIEIDIEEPAPVPAPAISPALSPINNPVAIEGRNSAQSSAQSISQHFRLPSRSSSRQSLRASPSPAPSERHFSVGRRHKPSISSTRVTGPSLIAITEDEDEEQHNLEVDTSTSLSHKQKETLETMRPIFAILCNEQGVQYSANNSQALQTTRRAAKGKKSMRNMLEEEKANMSRDDHLAYNARIRSLFKSLLRISQDDDFINHAEADLSVVAEFEENGYPVPTLEDIHFDMTGDTRSLWNTKLFELLTVEFLRRENEEELYSLPTVSDEYLDTLIVDRFTRLKSVWTKGAAQIRIDGTTESQTQIQSRINEDRETKLKVVRHRERRSNKLKIRARIVEGIIELKRASNSGDLKIWEWLFRVLEYLGVDGMSSEESSVENNRVVYRVKIMAWRRDITDCLNMIDKQRHLIPGLFSNSGSKGVAKQRGGGPGFLVSDRAPVLKLPRAFYDDAWFNGIGERRQLTLKVSKERFEWLKVHAQMI